MSVHLQHHALGVTWSEPEGMMRAAHALRGEEGAVWLIDPFEDAGALAAAAALGPPAGVVQLLDRHNRDCEAIATRLGVPLARLPERVSGAPFEVLPVISMPRWHEIALWWPLERALVVAEAVGTAPYFALGRRAGAHPLLRVTGAPGELRRHTPEMLLVGHGPALEFDAGPALADAIAQWRWDLPRLILRLPSMLLSWRR